MCMLSNVGVFLARTSFDLYDISSNQFFSQEKMLCKEIASLMKEKGRKD